MSTSAIVIATLSIFKLIVFENSWLEFFSSRSFRTYVETPKKKIVQKSNKKLSSKRDIQDNKALESDKTPYKHLYLITKVSEVLALERLSSIVLSKIGA